MKVLILVCHPNIDKSLNHALARATEAHLKKNKHEVRFVDLLKIKFNPNCGPHDFKKVQNTEFFDIQAEQKYALKNDNFAKDVKEQMDNLTWADTVIFQYPLYWWTYPAAIKGYMDRIYGYYFAYGGGNSLKLNMLHIVTSGGNYGGRYKNIMSFDMWKAFGNKVVEPLGLSGVFPIGMHGESKEEIQKKSKKRHEDLSKKVVKHLDTYLLGDKVVEAKMPAW